MSDQRRTILRGGLLIAAVCSHHHLGTTNADSSNNLRREQDAASSNFHQNGMMIIGQGVQSVDQNGSVSGVEQREKIVERSTDLDTIVDLGRNLQTGDDEGDHIDEGIDTDLAENTKEALERHDQPLDERDVIGDSIFPFFGSRNQNIFDRRFPGDENNNVTESSTYEYLTHSEELPSHHQQGP